MAKSFNKSLGIILIIAVVIIALFFVAKSVIKPDLVISNVSMGYASNYPSYITITNKGFFDVDGRVTLCVWDKDYREKSGQKCSMQVTNYDPMDSTKNLVIKRGESVDLTMMIGAYFPPLNFEIDSDNVVKESNEDNNQYTYLK